MDITRTTITPEEASRLLGENHGNRELKQFIVNTLAADIEAGRFVFNGDTIRVSKTGRLLDGQHRLTAVVQTGIPIETILITGLDDDVQTTIDTGSPRKFSDVLTMQRNTKNATTVGAVTLATYLYQQNDGRFNNQILARKRSATRDELLEWFDAHTEEMLVAATLARRIQASPARLSTQSTACTLFGAALFDPDLAALFAETVAEGDAAVGDPARQLREYGIRRSQAANKSTNQHCHLLTVTAWNKYVSGVEARMLKFVATSTRTAILDDAGRVVFPIPTSTPTEEPSE